MTREIDGELDDAHRLSDADTGATGQVDPEGDDLAMYDGGDDADDYEDSDVESDVEDLDAHDVNEGDDNEHLSMQENQAVEAYSSVEGLQREKWDSLKGDERLQALQEGENRLAAIQGRDPASIEADSLGSRHYGSYNPATNEVVINSDRMQDDDVDETVNTLAHEGRHSYQKWAIGHLDYHGNAEDVESWRDNLEPGTGDNPYPNYIRFDEDEAGYYTQPVEKDAFRFGDSVSRRLYGG